MNKSILADELAELDLRIGQVRQRQEALEGELHVVETELETFSADIERFDALRDACNALEKLGKLEAEKLFWEGIQEGGHAAHMDRVRGRISRFQGEINGILEKQASLQEQVNQCRDELDILYDEVSNAYDREERRREEYAIEREISPVPYHAVVMPWSRDAESERRFRRAVLTALFICFVLSTTISIIKVPVPNRMAVVQVPERLVAMLKNEPPRPLSVRKLLKEMRPKQAKEEPKPKQREPEIAAKSSVSAAREKPEGVGILKFKNAFANLMKEIPVAKVGVQDRLSKNSPRVKGQALAQRALIAMQARDRSSGGIGDARISRNIGNGDVMRLGIGKNGKGVGFVRITSDIAGTGSGQGRPLSGQGHGNGLAPGRTDEEIQIVFDRHKAALYRIYNRELRKNPALRGNLLMRITIEPDGSVSLCRVESTDLVSPELVSKIIERVKGFNFGPKKGVKRMTILYPIDFLPAG